MKRRLIYIIVAVLAFAVSACTAEEMVNALKEYSDMYISPYIMDGASHKVESDEGESNGFCKGDSLALVIFSEGYSPNCYEEGYIQTATFDGNIWNADCASVFQPNLVEWEEIENLKWKALSIANTFLSLYIIFIATASRTTMLAVIGAAITYGFLYFFIICKGNKIKRSSFSKLLFIVLGISLIIIMSLFIVPSLKDFILNKIIRIDSLSTGSNRLQCYKSAWEMGHGNRLLGFSIADFTQQTGFLHTHNVFLEVLSFSGLLGFIPFVIYITSSAINIFKNIKKCLLDILSNDSKCALCFIATIFTAFIIWGITENGAIYSLAALSFFTQLAFGVSNTLAHKSSSI